MKKKGVGVAILSEERGRGIVLILRLLINPARGSDPCAFAFQKFLLLSLNVQLQGLVVWRTKKKPSVVYRSLGGD